MMAATVNAVPRISPRKRFGDDFLFVDGSCIRSLARKVDCTSFTWKTMTIRVWGARKAGYCGTDKPLSRAPEQAVKQSLCIAPGMAKADARKLNNWF
jgi:hypothetical protein